MYIEKLNEEVRQYFRILSEEFPEWLLEYIETPELIIQKYLTLSIGIQI